MHEADAAMSWFAVRNQPAGVDRSQKDVDKLIKKLNIQFDNLCQVGHRQWPTLSLIIHIQ
jgi:hypothetical protein